MEKREERRLKKNKREKLIVVKDEIMSSVWSVQRGVLEVRTVSCFSLEINLFFVTPPPPVSYFLYVKSDPFPILDQAIKKQKQKRSPTNLLALSAPIFKSLLPPPILQCRMYSSCIQGDRKWRRDNKFIPIKKMASLVNRNPYSCQLPIKLASYHQEKKKKYRYILAERCQARTHLAYGNDSAQRLHV